MSNWTKWTVAGLMAFSLAACGGETEDAPDTTNTECNGGKCDIIGDDDRRDEFQGDVTERLKEIARSTAMVVGNDVMIQDDQYTSFTAQTLGETYMMCPDSPFVEQPVTGFCSATLVGPDIMLTNGHCITSQQQCETSSFVFDFAMTEEGQALSSVPSENVYQCQQVLAWDYTNDCDVDFAIVKLDRNVAGREPLPTRPSIDPLDADNMVIIGHPFGLPRKYALLGKLQKDGSNVFSTTHDIFGGNSGSSMIDANTGEVQGLVTCGGSNLTWEFIDEGWALDRKTGQACDTSCDDAGLYPDGAWEECTPEGTRRRCTCDGTQLVWEKRECLSFESETSGQCSREAQYDEFTCETAPWLCPTPVAQHTKHFVQFVGDWKHFSGEAIELPKNAETSSTITIDEEGAIQALSVSFDLVGDADASVFDFAGAQFDLTVTLRRGEDVFELVKDGVNFNGTAFDLTMSPSGTQAFQLPFMLQSAAGTELSGEWTLEVKNGDFADHTIHGWSISAIARPLEEIEWGEWPCTAECEPGFESEIPPIAENFEGDAADIDTELVQGTLTEGWEVEVLDENGTEYEVTKTRRSQTLSLKTGEFAITKDFGVDIGGRDLTIDYRYDGDGWFQVWADDHILLARQSFTQTTDTVALPLNARRIRIVIGATNDAQFHEATLYSLELTGSQVQPATCVGILTCNQGCGQDSVCQQSCIDQGTVDAQNSFWAFNDCISTYCNDATLSDDAYTECAQTQCADSLNTCYAN